MNINLNKTTKISVDFTEEEFATLLIICGGGISENKEIWEFYGKFYDKVMNQLNIKTLDLYGCTSADISEKTFKSAQNKVIKALNGKV